MFCELDLFAPKGSEGNVGDFVLGHCAYIDWISLEK